MKKSGLINPKDLETRIQADSLEELNQKLYQFVGKEGKFMPYTKAVQISLNNPNLKDLEIIDTPGVNDPIVSRETCTKALLKECDVVFVISPSNLTGFLTKKAFRGFILWRVKQTLLSALPVKWKILATISPQP
ncbi:hypothetical protein VN0944_05550 [Helicobacter pylori]